MVTSEVEISWFLILASLESEAMDDSKLLKLAFTSFLILALTASDSCSMGSFLVFKGWYMILVASIETFLS